MEDWKIKISVLWLFTSIAFLAHQIIVLMEPGVIAQLMAGEAEDQKKDPLNEKLLRKKSLLQESLKVSPPDKAYAPLRRRALVF